MNEVSDRALNEFYPDPQQREPIPVWICAECGKGIFEGVDYYEVYGDQFCEECGEDLFKRIAERD